MSAYFRRILVFGAIVFSCSFTSCFGSEGGDEGGGGGDAPVVTAPSGDTVPGPSAGIVTIVQGSAFIARNTGSHSLGETMIGSQPVSVPFTVINDSDREVSLSEVNSVTLSGDDASLFAATTAATNTSIPPGSQTDFTITFTPSVRGDKSARVTVAFSPESGEPDYSFALFGSVVGSKVVASGVPYEDHAMTVDGSAIYIACTVSHGDYNRYKDLRVLASVDGGATFTSSVVETVVASNGYNVKQPAIAVRNGFVHLSYMYTRQNYEFRRKYAKSTDGGTSWSVQSIFTTTNTQHAEKNLRIAVTDTVVAVVSYVSAGEGNRNIAISRSLDGGVLWDPCFGFGLNEGEHVSMTSDGSYLYLGYLYNEYYDMMFFKTVGFSDIGSGSIYKRFMTTGVSDGSYTSTAISGSNVYLVFYNWGQNYLQLLHSGNGGTTWDAPVNIMNASVSNFTNSLIARGNELLLAYYHGSSQKIRFIKSLDKGATWQPSLVVDSGSAGQYNPIIASDAVGNLYISYYDYTNKKLRLAKSVDGGDTW